MSVTTVATPKASTAPWLAGFVALLLLAAAGAWRVPALVEALSDVGAAAPLQVETSRGIVTLAGHELLDGPSPEDLGGVTHGIGGYVDSQHALVRVHLSLTGQDDVFVADAFALRRPDGTEVPPDASTLPLAALPSGAHVDASLSFIVPRATGSYALVVRDGDAATALPLGDVDAAPRPDAHQH